MRLTMDAETRSRSSQGSESSSIDSGESRDRQRQQNESPSSREGFSHFSFAEHQEESSSSTSADQEAEQGNVPTGVAADYERQVLLLMLLAQVCALHDPTPRTFTVHVLELFERGILDRQSIHFLFDLGLVPSTYPSNMLLPPSSPTKQSSEKPAGDLAIIPANKQNVLHRQRSLEASAIRSTLERQEKKRLSKNVSMESDPGPTAAVSSWSAEHHPLSLSRYQREFEQVRLLSSGSFGHVYQATNKMDGRDYAIKRVPFSATGYSRESVQQVVREVHCLAVCDHPNVVRYYTSWLEPSWMTGSGGNVIAEHSPKLLTDIQQMVASGNGSEAIADDLQAYFKDDPSLSRPRPRQRRFSFDASESHLGDQDDVSEWTVNQSKDDSYLSMHWRRDGHDNGSDMWQSRRQNNRQQNRDNYRYQICLFIQMELCHPATLADWIRERNQKLSGENLDSRIGPALEIFRQIVSGLSHVHKKGIVHRDLKPANVFASREDGVQFKIGDFGLSKLIRSATRAEGIGSRRDRSRRPSRLLLEYQAAEFEDMLQTDTKPTKESSWKDPLTAGVGTASYAAPEQVSSRSYGTEADIFSLGLILLELLFCFSTEHERLQTFHDCRYQRKLPDELDGFPMLSRTILHCTEPKPQNRPVADDLLKVDMQEDIKLEEPSPTCKELGILKTRLVQKEKELETCKRELSEKDRQIDELRRRLSKVTTSSLDDNGKQGVAAIVSSSHHRIPSAGQRGSLEHASSCDSSSEDEL